MSWITTGAVNLVNGSNVVTGVGSKFLEDARIGDGFRGPNGALYEVTNIPTNTSLTIQPAYEGATVNAAPYFLVPIEGYVKDSADQLRTATGQIALIPGGKQDKNDNLTALSGLTGAADRIPYFTGAGALSLATLTAKARLFIARTDAAGMRAEITAASSGANSDITSLTGLTAALSVAQGGTGGKDPASARAGLGLGTTGNYDILPVAKGGTGATTAAQGIVSLGGIPSGGPSETAGTTFVSGGLSNFAAIADVNNRSGSLIIHNGANNAAAAAVTFLREGSFGVHFGLNTDNNLSIGGWSMGANAYVIYHAGNTTRAADGTLKAI